MPLKSILIGFVLAVVAFFHISFIFQLLRAPDDAKVMAGLLLTLLFFLYPRMYKILHKIKFNK